MGINTKRIDLLDSFRGLAILGVLFTHLFYRWNDATYPYLYANLFHYGFKGVPFFFMISGFVICYTLENTLTFVDFWKKRFIRLFPSMFIASSLTFIFLLVFDEEKVFPNSHLFRNYLVSLTFLLPNIFDFIFSKKIHFSYINSSYWSLWPEIQFYLYASLIYFYNKSKFFNNFLVISSFIILGFGFISYFDFDNNVIFEKIVNLFSLIKHLRFFFIGALFYQLFSKKRKIRIRYLIAVLAIYYLTFWISYNEVEIISTSIMYILFLILVFAPNYLFFLNNKVLIKIGYSSYFLYLIHEYIGVVVIKKIVNLFYPYSFIAPLMMIILFIILSIKYSKYIESKITIFLRKLIFKIRLNENSHTL